MLYLTTALTAYILCVTALLGLVMGSFLTCFSWRLAHGGSVLKGRSHCDACGHVLGASDLVPIFSWLFLRGKCRYCASPISARCPVVEALTAAIYVSVVLRYDVTLDALGYLLLASLLIAISLVDLDTYTIPNGLVLAGICGFVVLALLSPAPLSRLARGFGGSLAVALPLLLLVLAADKLLGRETMGGGDLKLLFMLGLWFDWKLNLLLLILSCFLGLLLALVLGKAKPGTPFPFGPALAAAGWLTLLFGQWVLGWYLGFFF